MMGLSRLHGVGYPGYIGGLSKGHLKTIQSTLEASMECIDGYPDYNGSYLEYITGCSVQ